MTEKNLPIQTGSAPGAWTSTAHSPCLPESAPWTKPNSRAWSVLPAWVEAARGAQARQARERMRLLPAAALQRRAGEATHLDDAGELDWTTPAQPGHGRGRRKVPCRTSVPPSWPPYGRPPWPRADRTDFRPGQRLRAPVLYARARPAGCPASCAPARAARLARGGLLAQPECPGRGPRPTSASPRRTCPPVYQLIPAKTRGTSCADWPRRPAPAHQCAQTASPAAWRA
jgi:hypothetical protein